MDVVVVIRFVAMEIIPVKRLAQEKSDAKERLIRIERVSLLLSAAGPAVC